MWRRIFSIGVMITVIAILFIHGAPIVAQDSPLVPKFDEFCQASGYPYAYWGNRPVCGYGNGQIVSVEMNVVCTWSYGYGYDVAVFTDPNNPNSWECFAGYSPYLNPRYPQAQETVNGGVHVAIWCAMTGQGGGVASPHDPWSWKCANANPVDFGQACIDTWGDARPVAIPPATSTDIYGWRCVNAPPQIPNTPTPQPQVCQSSVGIIKGIRVWVIRDDDSRIRTKASVYAKLIDRAPYGSQLIVVNGPVCGGKYVWWYVLYQTDTERVLGWTAEASPYGDVWLVTYQP